MPPANDDFANAQVITGLSGSVAGDNTGATNETSEPVVGDASALTVWFAWTCPADVVSVTFDTLATDNGTWTGIQATADTTIGIYTGPDVASLATEASNDDVNFPTECRSSATFAPTPATTYYIQVAGYDSGELGPFVLSWVASLPSGPTITSWVTDPVRVDGKSGGPSPVAAGAVNSTQYPTEVVITGTDFDDLVGVTIGGVSAVIVSSTSTTIRAEVPAFCTTRRPIVVTTDWGSASTGDTFEKWHLWSGFQEQAVGPTGGTVAAGSRNFPDGTLMVAVFLLDQGEITATPTGWTQEHVGTYGNRNIEVWWKVREAGDESGLSGGTDPHWDFDWTTGTPAILDDDDFDRADSASNPGSTTGGRAWTVQTPSTAWGISSNQLYAPDVDNAGTSGTILAADFGISDFSMEMDVPEVGNTPGSQSGPAWRVADATHWFLIDGDKVYRNIGAGSVVVATAASALADGDHVKVRCWGSSHVIHVNGSPWASFADLNGETNTKHGFYTADTGHIARFENFAISTLGSLDLAFEGFVDTIGTPVSAVAHEVATTDVDAVLPAISPSPTSLHTIWHEAFWLDGSGAVTFDPDAFEETGGPFDHEGRIFDNVDATPPTHTVSRTADETWVVTIAFQTIGGGGVFPLRLRQRRDNLNSPRLPRFSDSRQRSARVGGDTYY